MPTAFVLVILRLTIYNYGLHSRSICGYMGPYIVTRYQPKTKWYQPSLCLRLISLDMGPYNHKLTIQWSPIAAQLWLSRNLFSQKRWGIVYLWSKNKLQSFKLFNASIMSSSYLYFNYHYHHMTLFSTPSTVLKNSVHWIKLRCSCSCCCTTSCDVICLLMTHKVNRQ